MKILNLILGILIFQLSFAPIANAQSNVSKDAQQTIDSLEKEISKLQNSMDSTLFAQKEKNLQKVEALEHELEKARYEAHNIEKLIAPASFTGISALFTALMPKDSSFRFVGKIMTGAWLAALALTIFTSASDPVDIEVKKDPTKILGYASLVHGQMIARNPQIVPAIQDLTKILSAQNSKLLKGEIQNFDELEQSLSKDLDSYYPKYNPKLTEAERALAANYVYISLASAIWVRSGERSKWKRPQSPFRGIAEGEICDFRS